MHTGTTQSAKAPGKLWNPIAGVSAAIAAVVGFSDPAVAESAHYSCGWTGRVGQPFTLSLHNGTTYIEGSLGVFGQVAPTEKIGETYRASLALPGGAFVIEWPAAGGAMKAAAVDLNGAIQGGHPRAAQCKLED